MVLSQPERPAPAMTATPRQPDPDITGVVLAGGRARRMGGEDKGLVQLAGRAMVEYVVEALRPQVGRLLLNANRNAERYAALTGCEVVADVVGDYAGPLAGMASALEAADTPLVLSAPCDSPLVAPDLAARMHAALRADGAEIAVARDADRLQPVFALLARALLPDLRAALEAGERKIDRWYATHRVTEVDFSDHASMFLNINTPEERDALAVRLEGAPR